MSQIGAGAALKSSAARELAPPKPAEARDDLMSMIRSGNKSLRKVDVSAPKEEPVAAGGPLSSVMAILKRRAAIEGSDDDDDDDDEWD